MYETELNGRENFLQFPPLVEAGSKRQEAGSKINGRTLKHCNIQTFQQLENRHK